MKAVDSTFLIDIMNGREEVNKVLDENALLLTTQINIFEVIRGLFRRNVSPEKFLIATEMLEQIRVLSLDDNGIIKAAEISAKLIKKGCEISDADCLIAGICLSKGITTIITRNTKHFERIAGLNVESY